MTDKEEYVERRIENRSGCVVCGADVHVGSGVDLYGYCSADGAHFWDNRRKSTKCGCGKWNCGAPGDPDKQMRNGVWCCQYHPERYRRIEGEHPDHHTDGSQACETNHRSPDAEVEWQAEYAKWKASQATLPDLAAVMDMLHDKANPLSFDGHDNFKFVVENPEDAAICIHKMYDTLVRIQIGKDALAEIPIHKRR